MKLRIPLLSPKPPLVECTTCGKCCTYVSVGIDAPRSVASATEMLWYLYHQNVTLYRDGDGEWSVVFETRCRNLAQDLLCSIYEHRPEICRDFDNKTCEINDPEGGLAINSPQELLDYLRVRRPKLYKKLEAKYVPPQGLGSLPRTATGG